VHHIRPLQLGNEISFGVLGQAGLDEGKDLIELPGPVKLMAAPSLGRARGWRQEMRLRRKK